MMLLTDGSNDYEVPQLGKNSDEIQHPSIGVLLLFSWRCG